MGNLFAPTWNESPAVAKDDRNSGSMPASTLTNASSTTISSSSSSCSASRLSVPNMASVTPTPSTLIRRPSAVFRPMGVAEMEIKSYCSKIKMVVGGTKLSVSDNLNFLDIQLSPDDEIKVLNCLENIVMIVERPDALPLEPSALKDLNIAVKSMQTNQPTLVNRYTEIIEKATKLIESKTITSISPASIAQAPLSGRTTPQGLDVSLSIKLHGGEDAPITPQLRKISSAGRLFDESLINNNTSPTTGNTEKRDTLSGSSHGLLSSNIDDDMGFLDLTTATEVPLVASVPTK